MLLFPPPHFLARRRTNPCRLSEITYFNKIFAATLHTCKPSPSALRGRSIRRWQRILLSYHLVLFAVLCPLLFTLLSWLATGRTVRGSNTGGRRGFPQPSHPTWGPPSPLYVGFQVFFPGVKWPGRGLNHPPPSSAEVKERVKVYLFFPLDLSGLL